MVKRVCFASIDVEDGGAEQLDKILNVFKRYGVSATLFVTGEVLEKYRSLAKEWERHYEIASHSFSHRFWNTLGSQEKKDELERFIGLYQEIFGRKPLGFRAPSHIIDREGLEILEEKGFLYDSSVVPHYPPLKRYRGYRGRFPLLPYFPEGLKILEIPVRGQVFGIPLAGAWIAKIPLWFYKVLFLIYRPSSITLNMHSWDIGKPSFLAKLDKLLNLLKRGKYLFLNGEQIYKNYR